MTVGKSLPRPLCKWWKRFRRVKDQVPMDGLIHAAVELYVPWWAWPFELTHRMVFGNLKLTRIAIEGIADGKVHEVKLN